MKEPIETSCGTLSKDLFKKTMSLENNVIQNLLLNQPIYNNGGIVLIFHPLGRVKLDVE